MKQTHPEHQYLDLLHDVLKNGIKNTDRGTGAVSYSVFGRQTRYDLTQGFPLLTTKRVYWKGVLYELFWFLTGQSNIKYLVDHGVHIWDDYPYKIWLSKNKKNKVLTKEEFVTKIATKSNFAKKHGNLPKIYGELWRHWPTRKKGHTIDQFRWLLSEITADPECRNTIVTSWNPEYLYTMADYNDASRFPICHNMYQVSQKDGKISLQLYQRSADLFLGVPFNIASYALLTHLIAYFTGYKVGEFIHTFGDAHIYENHLEQVKIQLAREPRNLPKIQIQPGKNLDTIEPEDILLTEYDPHLPLKGELTVAGGLYESQTTN